MPFTKRLHPSGLDRHTADTENTVWILIVILVGLACFATFTLLRKVGG